MKKTNTLMLNFAVVLDSETLDIDKEEVDEAKWFSFEEAKNEIAKILWQSSFVVFS